ncbi:MAG: PhnD/SsuA/transferrin family substrate-binding protein, partial [Candidatus Omnitrophica bacterium]|nr:PhnD/SsuA/transferrin family substrate-binding protein [Candidatus Omnitrophota bacterium]MBU1925249.1 PhnD/SsuA/transferrin family substrate-binding protein [Candidatus Omnitrophota bacterium]
MKKQKGPQSIKSAVLIVAAALVVWYGHSPAQAKEQTHTIGVLEERGKQQCLKRWEPTARYLNRAIPKREFKIIPLEYAELIPAAQNKSVDFILVNPGLYVELETGFGAQAIATLEALAFGKGYSKFGGVVFVLKNRAGIRHLKDIKGKTMMAVSRESFGGWVAMLREFKNIGIDPEKDCSSFQFGGTQDAVVDAVKNNAVEIGCVATSVLERMAAEGKIDIGDFRVIHEHEAMDTKEFKDFPFLHSTRIYPQWPLAKTKTTDEKLSKAVTNALFSIEPDHLAAVTGEYFGWTNPLNYQPAHECLKELRLRPYREYGKVALGAVIRHYRAALSFAALLFLLLIAGLTVAGRLNQNLFKSQARLKQEMLERKAADQKLLSKEAQYRTLFENSRSPIVILDNRGNYLNANKAALEFLECGPDELVTKNVKDYLAPGPAQDIISEHDKLGKRGGAIEAEYYVGGRIKVLELSFTPFIWKGKPAVIGIGKDISERRNTEKMIRESEAKFRRLTQELAQGQEATLNILEDLQEAKEALEVSRGNFMNIVENSADGITVVNHKNVILFINPAATKLFNQPAEQLLGTHLHFPVVTRETKEVEILADNQIVRMVEVKAAETRWGTEPAYIIVLHDITESKNAERALRLAAREWRTTFDAIGDGVAVLNRNATVMRCNKTLTGLLGKGFKD